MNMNRYTIPSIVSAFIIGISTIAIIMQVNIDQKYNDFIVGNITWFAGSKYFDLISLPCFIIIFSYVIMLFNRIFDELIERNNINIADKYGYQLLIWSVPFVLSIIKFIHNKNIDKTSILVSIIGIFSFIALGLRNKSQDNKINPDLWGALLISLIFISMIPAEVAVVLSRLPLNLVGELNPKYYFTLSLYMSIFFIIMCSIMLIKYSFTNISFRNIAFFSQLGLPMLFFSLYPTRFLINNEELLRYKTSIYLYIFIFFIIGIAYADIIRRFYSKSSKNYYYYFSPVAIFAIFSILQYGNTTIPQISPDDYHFGEKLLGLWSYLNGYVPYVDYIPAHGIIIDDINALFSFIFYDGTASSFNEAGRLVNFTLSLITIISIYVTFGSIILAFLSVYLLNGHLILSVLTLFICLWLNPTLRQNPNRWLCVWIATSPVAIIAVPPQGILLVAAFSILAIRNLWDQFVYGNKKSWLRLCFVIILTMLAILSWPINAILFGAINYVLTNGPINQVAYGILWSFSWNNGLGSIWLDCIRMTWIFIPLVSIYVMIKTWDTVKFSDSYFYSALIFFVFSFLLIPYSMGRIDPTAISRPGAVAILGWAIIIPFLLWQQYSKLSRAFLILIASIMGGFLGVSNSSLSTLHSIATQKIHTPMLNDTAAAEMPNIGRGIIDEKQWKRLSKLNYLLKSKLSDTDTYLDLTSRNANYFYLNRIPPIPVTAPYNMASPVQQMQAIEKLTKSMPKLALLKADNIVHDGGGLALRNPLLYRFVIENYVPRMENGFIVGYQKGNPETFEASKIRAEVKDLTDQNWLHGFGRKYAAIILADPSVTKILNAGDKVHFADGQTRQIRKIDTKLSVVWLDGAPITPKDPLSDNAVSIDVSPDLYKEYVASLFEQAFSTHDIKKIPVSWGRSIKSLSSKMTFVTDLSDITPSLHDLSIINDKYVVKGKDPYLKFNLSKLNIKGENAGLLTFDFYCFDKKSDIVMQIFWWGDQRNRPFEESSVKFNIENGTHIVPLDAFPRWLLLEKVKGLRFDIDNASSCKSFNISNLSLYQRKTP